MIEKKGGNLLQFFGKKVYKNGKNNTDYILKKIRQPIFFLQAVPHFCDIPFYRQLLYKKFRAGRFFAFPEIKVKATFLKYKKTSTYNDRRFHRDKTDEKFHEIQNFYGDH